MGVDKHLVELLGVLDCARKEHTLFASLEQMRKTWEDVHFELEDYSKEDISVGGNTKVHTLLCFTFGYLLLI